MTQTEKIKKVFRERGLTQKAVANQMNIKPQNLSRALKQDGVADDMLSRIVAAVNTLSRYQAPVTEQDMKSNEYKVICPRCGEEITIKVE